MASLSVPDPYLESARDACRAANTFLRTRFCEPFTDMEFGFPVTLALWPQMPAGRSFAVIWNAPNSHMIDRELGTKFSQSFIQ